jgi:hypothetical protein
MGLVVCESNLTLFAFKKQKHRALDDEYSLSS